MTISLAFDVYGTMIDTSGVVTALERIIGGQASALSQVWREKQLEYSFRRGLMQNYQDFSVCTEQALDYACLLFGIKITPNQKKSLMDGYKVLPPHSDVEEGLSRLNAAGFRMFAFSNGRADDVQMLLKNADIEDYFEGIVSTDEVKSYKPNPGVYAHFLRQSKSIGYEAWLISSNPFDVIGAISAGMLAAWVKRSPKAIFDPWEIEPTITVGGMIDLCDSLSHSGNPA